ncbi:MAG: hypothetical protein IJ774_15250 [Selenomonadaceae bacterium]|nr:hypothetical protein [Selenomonadaceae bacterium]
MDVVFIIVMFVVISIFDQLASRKKRRLPPPQNRDGQPNFDIPTLANDPNSPGEEIPLVVELPRPAEVRQLNPPPRPSRAETQFVREDKSPEIDVEFTPSTIVNGFILSELLDKPKALRKRRR